MPTSTSRDAYEDCYELLDKALEAERGVAASFTDKGEAYHFRVRLNAARQHERQLNKEVHPKGHPDHGRSAYDQLMFKIFEETGGDGGKWWVKIEKIIGPKEVVELAAE